MNVIGRFSSRGTIGFEHSTFRIPAPGHRGGESELQEYLDAANLRLHEFGEHGILRAQLVQLPQMTFGRVRISPVRVVWPRDAASLDRVVMLVSLDGKVAIMSGGEVRSASPGVHLIMPGDADVEFRVHEGAEEFFYIGASRAVIRDIDMGSPSPVTGVRIDDKVLVPLLAFIQKLCDAQPALDDIMSIRAVAVEVVRALTRQVLGDANTGDGTYGRAIRVIERQYLNPLTSVGDIAGLVDVSERTLHAVFAKQGTTVSRELRARRALEAAAIRKRAPAIARADLARAAGFGSISSMLRAMREFG